jgi:GAF domain-containing protein
MQNQLVTNGTDYDDISDEYTAVVDRVLDTLSLVDSPPEDAFDKFTRLVRRFIEVPVALVSFVEEEKDRQYFKSEIGLTGIWADLRQTPLSHSFCQYVKRDNKPLVVEDAPEDSRVCDNLAIPDLGVRAYIGVPIHGPDGAALGALCAIDGTPRIWDEGDLDIMVDLAACVTDQIRLRDALLRSHRI